MNRINNLLTREISVEEFDLVSGGHGASSDVMEEQIETVVVSGSYGGISSGSISSLGASITGNWGGGYGSFLQSYVPGAVATALRAGINKAGHDLEEIGEWTSMAGAATATRAPQAGVFISGSGAIIWGLGKSLQRIEP